MDPHSTVNGESGEETHRSRLHTILHWIAHEFHWSLLAVPVAVIALVYALSLNDIAGSADEDVFKRYMEILHPTLLAGFLLVAWGRWLATRDAAFAFLGVLAACTLSREIIGQGSSFIVYAGIVALYWYSVRHPEKLGTLFNADWVLSFIFMCFVCYATSQLLDRGAVKHIGRFILADSEWKLAHSSNLEEALESLGGGFLLLASLCVPGGRGLGDTA